MVVRQLIAAGAAVEKRNKKGESPLHLCIFFSLDRDFQEVVQLLVSKGAELNGQDLAGRTLLHKLVGQHAPRRIEFLINNFPTKLNRKVRDNEGKTPFDRAAEFSYQELERLLRIPESSRELGIITPVNKTNDKGLTGLMVAAQRGDLEYAQQLLKRGANINMQSDDTHKYTALHIAVMNNQPEMVLFLLNNKAQPRIADNQGNTVMQYSMAIGDRNLRLKIIQNLIIRGLSLNDQNRAGNTLLHTLILKNDTRSALWLINTLGQRINFSLRNKEGLTTYTLAEQRKNKQIMAAIEKQTRNVLGITTDVNKQNASGLTGLMLAIMRGNGDQVRAILARKPNLNLRSKQGNTALHLAVRAGSLQIIELLLRTGALATIANNAGDSSLHYVAWIRNSADRIRVTKLLRSRGAHPDIKNKQGLTVRDIAQRLQDQVWLKSLR